MPDQDGVCIDKIKNCKIDLEDQPDDLNTDKEGNYICDECLDGFGWDKETFQCVSCEVSMCDECKFSNGRPTCSKCLAGYTVDESGGCVVLDPNCFDQKGWVCKTCKSGYYYDGFRKQCIKCLDETPFATSCDEEGKALSCETGF